MLKVNAGIDKVILPQVRTGIEKIETKQDLPIVKIGPIPRPEDRDPDVIYIHTTPDPTPRRGGPVLASGGKLYYLNPPSKSNSSAYQEVSAKVDKYLKDFHQKSSPNSAVPNNSSYFYTNYGYKNLACYSGNSQNVGKILT